MGSNLVIKPISVRGFKKVILHIDADAFFASCEQAVHPHLKGKPVMTGAERGIVAAASYEAKACGVGRGVRVHEAVKACPNLIVLPSDYETYSLFSLRMFEILRRFTPIVEEYSIDEAFCDISGLRRTFGCSYEEIARRIQATILRELDLSVSIGVSVTKVLAKIASKHLKPYGITPIPGRDIHHYLAPLPVGKVWGIGPNTANFLNKHGIFTAYDFATRPEPWVEKHLTKPHIEIWHELNGRSVYEVVTEEKPDQKSISKCRTFTPPSDQFDYVFAQLVQNLENACIKARRHHLQTRNLVIHLRTQEFHDSAVELKLSNVTAHPIEMMAALRTGFESLFRPGTLYRATTVVLAGLQPQSSAQFGLFDDPVLLEKQTNLDCAVDRLSNRFGKHTLFLGASLPAKVKGQHSGERATKTWRSTHPLDGETKRQRFGIIVLDIEI